jgi:tetratricopeptide (TPR) repeat protein
MRKRLLRRIAWCFAALLLGAAAAPAHEDRDETLARLDRTIAASPKDPAPWRERAVLERRRGDFARAHADLGRAAKLGLGSALTQRERGLLWLAERRFAEAEASLRGVLAETPDDPPTLLAHARALAGLERFREASDTYERLVRIAPRSSPDVQLERIGAAEAAGGLERALGSAEQALAELGPVPALEQRALDLELRTGRIDAALARLDRLARAGGAREERLLQRAEILERAGREDAARNAYADTLGALAARTEARRGTPAAQTIAAEARDGIARLAAGDGP